MGDVYRVLGSQREMPADVQSVPIDDWLDDLMAEREAVIQRLRSLERPLVKYGRLKVETLPKRIR